MPDDDFDDQPLDEASALPEDIDEEDLDLEDEELSEEDLDEDADLDVGDGDDVEVDEVDGADDALLSVDEEEDYEDEEEDDGDDCEHPANLRRHAGDATEPEHRSNQGDDEKDDGVMQHGASSFSTAPRFPCGSVHLAWHEYWLLLLRHAQTVTHGVRVKTEDLTDGLE